jgi:sec-independent protein translocase protein TatC
MKTPFQRSEQPKVATPDDRMTLIEHLAELRTRIIRSMLAILVGIIVILAMYDRVLGFLVEPYHQMCIDEPGFCTVSDGNLFSLAPLAGFNTRLSVSMYGGIVLALPVLMWQLWQFVAPALHKKEKKYVVPFVAASVALFVLGGAIAYWTLPRALLFLNQWAGEDVQAAYAVDQYVRLIVLMIGAFGIAFEVPVLLVALQLVGVLTPQTLLKGWRYAVLACFFTAAVITPSGDPYSMLALALPMSLFYLVSVLIGFGVQRRKQRRAPSD